MDAERQIGRGAKPYGMDDVATIGARITARSTRAGISEAQVLARVEIAMLDGAATPEELVERLGIEAVRAEVMAGLTLSAWEQGDFGVAGRGHRLARLDMLGNRLLLPMILGPLSGKKRSAAFEAFRANRAARDVLLDASPQLVAVIAPVPADVTSASRSSKALPASEATVALALEVMQQRKEVLWPAPMTAQAFDVFRISYVLD